MPSPFPGMDPYLEATTYWRDVHASLIVYIRDALQPMLLPNYHARAEERIYLSSADHSFVPDVLITTPLSDYRKSPLAPVLDVTPDEPLKLKTVYDQPPERYLEIVDTASGELVTVIEVLSPSNKSGEGLVHYREKMAALRQTKTNIVEIDLLGFGEGAYALGKRKPMRLSSRYSVVVHRYDEPLAAEVYIFPLNQRLPRCLIPLLPQDADVVLDLPAVFNKCYDNGGYQTLVNYNAPPMTTLDSAETQYIDQLLREKGLRA